MSWHRFVDPVVAALPPGSFTAIVAGDDVPRGEGKPGPVPYLMGAEPCGVAPRGLHRDRGLADRRALRARAPAATCSACRTCATSIPNRASRSCESLRDVDVDTLRELCDGTVDRRPGATAPSPAGSSPRRLDRRPGGVLTAVVAGAAVLDERGGDDGPPPLPPGAVAVDAWAPYWALDDSVGSLGTRLDSVSRDLPVLVRGRRRDRDRGRPEHDTEEAQQFIDIARDSDARFVPSIVDEMPAGGMAAILLDPVTRAQHVETIRAFADDLDADGIDIDYEQFAFADGASTWETTRPAWVAFIEELSAALHADDRTLTVSIPRRVRRRDQTATAGTGCTTTGRSPSTSTHLRIMAYDFSTAEPGPIAPLAWVESTITGAIEATGSPDKLVLGLPAYGRNWPVATSGECPASEVQGRTAVSARSVDELVELRQAQPVRVDETGEWMFEYDLEVSDGVTSCVQTRQVHYVDGDGDPSAYGSRSHVSPRRSGALGVRLRRRIRVGCDPAHGCRSDCDNL